MTQYIDKNAVVAEIERRQKEEVSYCENGSFASWADENHYFTLETIKSFIDTLEVEEMDEKSTKHFPHWKPTKEQMSDLYHAATMNSISCPSLKLLYNDLKVIAQKGE